MGRTADRILGACLLVVRLLTAVAALAVVAGIVYVLLQPGSGSGGAGADAPPVATEPVAEDSHPPAVPLTPLTTDGPTRFVRRLEVGEELARLLEDVERNGVESARFDERYGRVRPFLLEADGEAPERPPDPLDILRQLTEPRRDLPHLVLAGAKRDDPLGKSLRVRAWTIGAPYPAEELARVSATIDHIVRRVRRDTPGGIDVIVTSGMGHDVFPRQAAVPWAAGVYFPRDQYCVARSSLRSHVRPEVVEHECIHAYCWSIPSFQSSRFVSEGIAEYLRLVHPGDYSLNVPRSRFADHFAALDLLLRNMQAHGVAIRSIDPHRLVDLSPREFYALRHFSYLVAQLTMAYVGGDVIERALAAGSDAAIVAAVRAIQWEDFLAFVRNEAKDGHPGRAVIVEDGEPEATAARDRAAIADALRSIGTGWPVGQEGPDPDTVRADSAGELGTEERVVAALRALLEEPNAGRVNVLGLALSDRAVSVPAVSDPIASALGGTPEGETPLKVARSLSRLVDRKLAALARSVKATGFLTPRTAKSLDTFESMLAKQETPFALVFIVDTQGADTALELELPGEHPPSVVLVVDISEDGEAGWLARKYDRPESLVAYWRLPLK